MIRKVNLDAIFEMIFSERFDIVSFYNYLFPYNIFSLYL